VTFDRNARTATLTVRAPEGNQPKTIEEIHAAGAQVDGAGDGARAGRTPSSCFASMNLS